MKLGLKLESVSVMSQRVVVPTGNYSVKVASAEVKETKAKTGHYLQVGFRITEGEYEGSVLTDRLNINNKNEDAVRIGLSALKTILTVGGHKNPNFIGDTDEMIGLELGIYVEENPHSFTGDDGNEIETTQNEIKSYFELKGDTVNQSSPEKKKADKPAPKKQEKEEAPAPKPEPKPEPVAEAKQFPWM